MKTILISVLAVLPAIAQAPGAGGVAPNDKSVPLSKVERKNRAPVSNEVLQVKLPKPAETKLEDGLTIMLIENHKLPTVTVRLSISGAGALYEPPDKIGLASLTAQMLKEGTATRTSKQIAEEMDRLGANISVIAPFGADDVTLMASGLSDNLPQWLALASDILLHPSFPESELAKLKQRTKVQLLQFRALPQFLVAERFSKAVYGEHPAANIVPSPEALDAITVDMLRKWHRERYVPQNSIVGVTGDVRATDVPVLLSSLPEWVQTSFKAPAVPPTQAVSGKHVLLVDRPNSVQTAIRMGNIAIRRNDADYPVIAVMNQILGAGPAGRLFMNLREEKGLTYGAYSMFSASKYAGPWMAFGEFRTDVTGAAMTEFLNEINRLRDQKVPESELNEKKRAIVAAFALSLEQPAQLLDFAMTRKIYDLPADYWDTYPAKITAVTAEDVQRAARKYLDPGNLQVVAVGDASKIKSALEAYGPITIYEPSGKPKS